MKLFDNVIFDSLENMMESLRKNLNGSYLIVVMFKTHSCPPCKATSAMLKDVDYNGLTNFESVSKSFVQTVNENKRLDGVYWLEYNCKSSESLPADYHSVPQLSAIVSPILEELKKVRSVPTFVAFAKSDKMHKLPVANSGFTDLNKLHLYFDNLYNEVMKCI
jgi:hypothetical protein